MMKMTWPNTWIHYVLAERYVGLFIVRETLPTLALDRAFIWISFCCDCCPAKSQIKPFISEYNKIISYYSCFYVFIFGKEWMAYFYFSFSFVVVLLRLFHSYSSFFCSLLLLFVDSLLAGCSDLLSPIFWKNMEM